MFDEAIATRLQKVLDDAVSAGDGVPGVIIRVCTEGGAWSGSAGVRAIGTDARLRTTDRFRAGSVLKPFISVVTLQLVEEGALSLDDRLPAVLPDDVIARVAEAGAITVRMLMSHTSGVPEWMSPPTRASIAANPRKVWEVGEYLELSFAKARAFAPGARYEYSNTNYNLLGEIIEHATGRAWREEVRERVFGPLGLDGTLLPEPGDASMPEGHARGYSVVDGAVVDLTEVDPSMAGAAGGCALVTTAPDLVRFWDGLLAGELFEGGETLREMLSFGDAPDRGGQVGYGLAVSRYVAPGGVEVVGHLGTTAGYTAFVGRLPAAGVTFAAMMNMEADPSGVLLPVIEVFVGGGS